MKLGPLQERWLHDLETTEEPQTKYRLHRIVAEEGNPTGFCCLGRLLATLGEKGRIQNGVEEFVSEGIYLRSSLPIKISNAVSLKNECSLGGLNDSGKSFKEIAAHIRENATDYFGEPK